MSRWLKTGLPIAVLLAAATGSVLLATHQPDKLQSKPTESTPPTVRVVTAHPSRVRVDVRSQGNAAPRSEIDLVAEVAGKVVYLHPGFAVGGHFKAGEVLLAVDGQAYQTAILRAEARLAEARRTVAQEQAAAVQAKTEWQVLGEGQPTPLSLHEPQQAEAQAKLKAAEADLAEAKLQLARSQWRAPFDGRVREKHVGPGQTITVGEKLARLYSADVAEVRLPVPVEQLALLDLPVNRPSGSQPRLGPKVTLSTGEGGPSWQGRIVRREGLVDSSSGMEYLVAEVADPFGWREVKPPLNPGSFVQAEIEGRELDGIFVLPAGSLNSAQEALLVDADQRLSIRKLSVLRTESGRILVNGGLQDGERVVVSSIDLPVAGMRVQVEPDSAPNPIN